MPLYTVCCLEKFIMETTYRQVEAASPEEAMARVRDGKEAYDESSPIDDDGEFIEVLSVKREGGQGQE